MTMFSTNSKIFEKQGMKKKPTTSNVPVSLNCSRAFLKLPKERIQVIGLDTYGLGARQGLEAS